MGWRDPENRDTRLAHLIAQMLFLKVQYPEHNNITGLFQVWYIMTGSTIQVELRDYAEMGPHVSVFWRDDE